MVVVDSHCSYSLVVGIVAGKVVVVADKAPETAAAGMVEFARGMGCCCYYCRVVGLRIARGRGPRRCGGFGIGIGFGLGGGRVVGRRGAGIWRTSFGGLDLDVGLDGGCLLVSVCGGCVGCDLDVRVKYPN